VQVQVNAAAFASDLRRACASESARAGKAIDDAVAEATIGLKEELRDLTFVALGRRVAYAWQSRFYPNKGQAGGPAGFVYTKAPRIIDFFRAERVVTPLGHAFAIPVSPVVKRFGKAMTIAEVETRFNQDLQARRLPSGNIGLFADLVRARSGRGFRQATKGRVAGGRKVELVLMFVLVKSLRSRKLIDLVAPANRWANQVPQLVDKKLDA
jgi:hypothetical protein